MIADLQMHEKVVEALDYDMVTGLFYKREGKSRGRVAGCVARHCNKDYRKIGLLGKKWLAHRLAIFYMTGSMPVGEVDHVDGNGLNNGITNLRVVTRATNLQNQKLYKNNQSGCPGVYWCQRAKSWRVYIGGTAGKKSGGTFKNFDDAVARRKQMEIEHGYHQNHGRAA